MTGTSRRELEAAVRAAASSIDGRHFLFQLSAHDLDLEVGGYVSLGDQHLGLVHELGYAWVEGAELVAALDEGTEAPPADSRIAIVRGSGLVLDADAEPFHDLSVARAATGVVAAHPEG
jgi:hypothetical protein